jgi:hypothetical protein
LQDDGLAPGVGAGLVKPPLPGVKRGDRASRRDRTPAPQVDGVESAQVVVVDRVLACVVVTAQQKIEIVLAGLRGDRSVKEVCRVHAISETLYYGWREKS